MRSHLSPFRCKGLCCSPGHIARTKAYWASVSGARGIEPFAPVLARCKRSSCGLSRTLLPRTRTSTCWSRSATYAIPAMPGQPLVILCEGIPDTLSVLVTGLKDTGACGLYGTGGWQPAWLPLFRRAGRVYVALARTFGTRGRVLIPPEDLGPKGDLNDWLQVVAKGDPGAFRSVLEEALAASPTPWALQIPAVNASLGALGSRRPSRRAGPPVRARPSGTAEPRCASAIAGEAVRGGAYYHTGSGS
jgi:hypothetical protein